MPGVCHILLALTVLCACAPTGTAQEHVEPETRASATQRKDPAVLLDRIELSDGRVLEGLIRGEAGRTLDLLQVLRPRGRNSYAVAISLPRAQVKSIQRMDDEQRQRVARSFRGVTNRLAIQSLAMDQLQLELVSGPLTRYRYRGDWFQLDSAVDEELTRQLALRLDQLFTAFRFVIAPRVEPAEQRPLRIMLLGTAEDYQAMARQSGAAIRNPSFYAREANLIIAGSNLAALAVELRQLHGKYQQENARLQAAQARLPRVLKREEERLGRLGLNDTQVRKQLGRLETRLKKEIAELEDRVQTASRQSQKSFQDQTDQLLTALAHEAFHAYLENYAYPAAEFDVPRWLNEGLAQVFESAVVEGGELRFDAPNRRALAVLLADLDQKPMSLRELVAADAQKFLVPHSSSAAEDQELSARHYAYAWGLAYYLAVEQGALDGDSLTRYFRRDDATPIAKLEALVGQPIDSLEADLYQAIRHWGRPTRRRD